MAYEFLFDRGSTVHVVRLTSFWEISLFSVFTINRFTSNNHRRGSPKAKISRPVARKGLPDGRISTMASRRLIEMFRGRIIRRLVLFAILICLLFAGLQRTLAPTRPIPPTPALSPNGIPNFRRQAQFWNNLYDLLESNPPGVDAPKRLRRVGEIIFKPDASYARPDLLYMPDPDVELLRKSHQQVVQKIEANTARLRLVYEGGKRGIVSAATKRDLPTLLVSLRMLRQRGTRFPVEVFIASKSEYDDIVCGVILPGLNANCIVMSDILGILWLDADCFPLHDAIEIFQSEPFTEIGLVTWPDFWVSSASPYFYNITSQPQPSLSERASTNGRQFLISKKTHAKTLLLASYYNYYGTMHYYRLLGQGAPGEGDKESFLAAASVLNQPFYAVREPIRSIGRLNADGNMTAYAMVQYSPTEDHKLMTSIFNGNSRKHFGLDGPNGRPMRAWVEEKETIDSIGGPKVERQLWSQVAWTACTLEEMEYKDWARHRPICTRANEYVDAVFSEGNNNTR
ncbi:alpha-1,2 mannosyltransferase [Histoplasma capsulatum var. duboisii H88]|uniref:Alpha-1,2 mannosyltransferase n=1 Tax=Ajellomyces capsulatus (strain H88) TaxID=544711 RepID=F0UG38_AJEC8|nr:alpha-1,2 mannosyltransferase [Histoplasma capsulatum var. duboisii H88]